MPAVAHDLVARVDLDDVVERLTQRAGWTVEHARQTEDRYRAFLRRVAVTDEQLEPTHDVDEFWHQHIIDTRKYSADCLEVFGTFLHHDPKGRDIGICCSDKS